MAERKWNSGKPPAPGWYNASVRHDPRAWRWWDGKQWSVVVYPIAPAEQAAKAAKKPDDRFFQAATCWTTYWPAGARVERSKP